MSQVHHLLRAGHLTVSQCIEDTEGMVIVGQVPQQALVLTVRVLLAAGTCCGTGLLYCSRSSFAAATRRGHP
jgi:hypothetical protein